MGKFGLVKKGLKNILPNSPLDFELKHAELVLKWVLKLKPRAGKALKIAAFSHDIDRAVHKITEKDLEDYSKINEFKKEHSIRSAEISLKARTAWLFLNTTCLFTLKDMAKKEQSVK